VIDFLAHTRDKIPSIHDDRDAQHAVPKELGAARYDEEEEKREMTTSTTL